MRSRPSRHSGRAAAPWTVSSPDASHGDDANARQRLIDAEVAVAQAQLVIIAAALQAPREVFDALGASGVSEELALDRHWRNARTLASHNPRVYKARIIGDWLINGKIPCPISTALGRGGQGN